MPSGLRIQDTVIKCPLNFAGKNLTLTKEGVSLDIENYCTLRWFFVPLSCGRA
ncbi:hypothetical protein QG78_004444 [Salmonella enterica subsp. enterica]|nr:hypothetical protein [Salmonella enterica subsp. enterica]